MNILSVIQIYNSNDNDDSEESVTINTNTCNSVYLIKSLKTGMRKPITSKHWEGYRM
jgi:hypothetical protein